MSPFCGRGRFVHVLQKKTCLCAGLDLLATVIWDVKVSIFNSFTISLLKKSN